MEAATQLTQWLPPQVPCLPWTEPGRSTSTSCDWTMACWSPADMYRTQPQEAPQGKQQPCTSERKAQSGYNSNCCIKGLEFLFHSEIVWRAMPVASDNPLHGAAGPQDALLCRTYTLGKIKHSLKSRSSALQWAFHHFYVHTCACCTLTTSGF